jgi:hypothetical protein
MIFLCVVHVTDDGTRTRARMSIGLECFPQRTVNGFKLDLFGLYHNVCARGGFPVEHNGSAAKVPWSWSKEIFMGMANYTSTHRCTSVGHDLIQSYRKYLLSYEIAHPEDVNKTGKAPTGEVPRGAQTARVRMAGVGGDKRRRTGEGSGRKRREGGMGGPRARGGAGRVGRPPRGLPPRGGNFNFSIGNRVRVYWPSDGEWYSGMVVMQETSAEGVVYSKVDYDDGDEEVLNLANEICECLDNDEDGLVYVPRPSSRRAGAAMPGQLALEYQGGHESETHRQAISMDDVLEAMNRREAARGLFELGADPYEARETYRLGYMMGVRRSAIKAVDIMKSMIERAFPEGDPMRDLVTKEDLHKAVVDGTYEADEESDEDIQDADDYDKPWPTDANVPTEAQVKEENERLRAERAAKLASTSSQSLNPDGSSKLVFKVKRARDGEGEDVATGGAANAAQGATNAAKPNEDLTTGPTLGDQRRIALNKAVNTSYAGDKGVLRWLDTHGWGHYAGAFAAYGVSRVSLGYITMTDLENMQVEAEIRPTMFTAIGKRRKRQEKYARTGT